jgi:hypothetical protein
MVFEPGGAQLAAATQLVVQASLQQWLGDRIVVQAVEVESEDSTLRVTVRYMVATEQRQRVAQFTRKV